MTLQTPKMYKCSGYFLLLLGPIASAIPKDGNMKVFNSARDY